MFQNCSAERDLSCLRGWMTLGINNDYNVILCLMNEFEFGTTQPSPLPQGYLGAEKGPSQYHLNKMFKISLKYHSRLFLNCLKSAVLKRLLTITAFSQSTVSQPPCQPLPYDFILSKPGKTEEELLQCQFIHLCAAKIQSLFRGYMRKKYHKVAMRKVRQFEANLTAVVRGWKTRRIMQCIKVKEGRNAILRKREEVERQQAVTRTTSNIFSSKKLQYLSKTLSEEVAQFRQNFGKFYQSGGWVFEPKAPQTSRQPRLNRQVESKNIQGEPPRRTKVREVRDRVQRRNPQQQPDKDHPLKEALNIQNARVDLTVQQKLQGRQLSDVNFEDRPIQAKGAYSLDDEAIKKAIKDEPKMEGKPAEKVEEDSAENASMKNKLKAQNRAKMEKRQKYDPRKAILEEKKRKVESKGEDKIQETATEKPDEKEGGERSKEPASMTLSKAIVDKIVNKEEVSNRGTVELPVRERGGQNRKTVANQKGNRGKAESKVDCWANRKTNKKQPETAQSYLQLHSRQQREYRQEEPPPRPVQRDRFVHNEQRVGINLEALIEVEKRGREQLSRREVRNEPQDRIQKAISYEEMRIQRHQRMGSPKKEESKEVYKDIEELQNVYQNQYQNRLNKLRPKLGLLGNAREKDRHGAIPVVNKSCSFIKRISELSGSHSMVGIISRVERSFRELERP